MGYYSYFILEAKGPAKEVKAFEEFLKTKEDIYDGYYGIKRLSLEFPSILFSLRREGEEAGDLEMSYYKNGKMQLCPAKITFSRYSPSKLE